MSGFVPDPGTDFTTGNERIIAARLDALARAQGITIYGLSGHRSPAHSVAVGGFPNDPHVHADAGDIGVNSQLRSSAGVLSEALLNQYGLTRPFPGSAEVNHVQLLPGWHGKTPAHASSSTPAGSSGSSTSTSAGGSGFQLSDLTNPAAFAGDVVNAILQPVEQNALRMLLYAVLILGGVGLVVSGSLRASRSGGRPPLQTIPGMEGI